MSGTVLTLRSFAAILEAMPYTIANSAGKKYYLHQTSSTLRNGEKRTVYYFAATPSNNTIEELPPGYWVYESWRTGQPYLKKLPATDGRLELKPGSEAARP